MAAERIRLKGGQKEGHPQKDRLPPADILCALPEVRPDGRKYAGKCGAVSHGGCGLNSSITAEAKKQRMLIHKMGRRPQALSRMPPSMGPQQIGQSLDHVDDGVSSVQGLLGQQEGDAGLNRGLVRPRQYRKAASDRPQLQAPRGASPHISVYIRISPAVKKSSPAIMLRLLTPVGHCSADGRQNHHGQKGTGGDHPKQRGGTGLPQQIEREGKVEDGVAE